MLFHADCRSRDYNPAMHRILVVLLLATWLLVGCNKPANQPTSMANTTSSSTTTSSTPRTDDAVQQKLTEYSGGSAIDCGRLDVQAGDSQLKSASGCAMQAAQAGKPFHIAYDMPGMSVGVAGNADGKLFTVQSQTGSGLTSGPCPSAIRVASSGRISCFAPGDMGSMGTGHGSMGAMGKIPNPHQSAPPKQ